MIDSVTEKLRRLKNKFFSGIFYLVGILLVIFALVIISFQGFLYLYNGAWTSYPLQNLLAYTPYVFYSWVLAPESWQGLHKAVTWLLAIPMSFVCFFFGYSLMKISDFIALFSD